MEDVNKKETGQRISTTEAEFSTPYQMSERTTLSSTTVSELLTVKHCSVGSTEENYWVVQAKKKAKLRKKLKQEYDQQATEYKYRCIDRKEVELDDRLYDICCAHHTRDILKKLDYFFGSRTIVLNDCYYVKSVWEKIKAMKDEKEALEAEKRKTQALLCEQRAARQISAIVTKPKSSAIKRTEKIRKVIPMTHTVPVMRAKTDESPWAVTSSVRNHQKFYEDFRQNTKEHRLPKIWSKVDIMYRRATMLLCDSLQTGSYEFWMKKSNSNTPMPDSCVLKKSPKHKRDNTSEASESTHARADMLPKKPSE